MKNIVLILFLATANIYAQEPKLNEEWVRKDVENFVNTTDFLKNDILLISQLKDLSEGYHFVVKNGLLFAKRVVMLNYGGYVSIKFTIIYQKDKIIYLKAELDEGETEIMFKIAKDNRAVSKSIGSIWKINNKRDPDGSYSKQLYYIFEDKNKLERYYNSIDKFLGKKKEYIFKNTRIKEAYNILLYPKYVYPYSRYVGVNKIVPKGRKAINLLVANNRFDLIANLLKGYNTEGRAYALEAIIKLHQKLPTEILPIIKNLKRLPILVYSIEGCFENNLMYYEIINDLQNMN